MKADMHANPPTRVGCDPRCQDFFRIAGGSCLPGLLSALARVLAPIFVPSWSEEITDERYTVEYYRQDGVLVVTDFGSGDELERGRRSVANDKLCNTYKDVTLTKCIQVWRSGDAVSLRLREQDRPPLAYVSEHKRR